MLAPLRVTLIQADLVWEDPGTNRARFAEKITPLTGSTDLIILPEMFTTGFSMNPEPLAERMDGPTLSWLATQAASTGAAICGSLIIQEDNAYYNRLVWMQPDGQYFTYDKRHRFTLAGEHEYYAAGKEQLVISWRGWKIRPLICYDLRFPVWSRNTPPYYDLLLYVANWPARRRFAWTQLLIARAIENQAYTIGVNRIGLDGQQIPHAGDSVVLDYSGTALWQQAEEESTTTLTLDQQKQAEFRDRFRFLADQDSFQVEV